MIHVQIHIDWDSGRQNLLAKDDKEMVNIKHCGCSHQHSTILLYTYTSDIWINIRSGFNCPMKLPELSKISRVKRFQYVVIWMTELSQLWVNSQTAPMFHGFQSNMTRTRTQIQLLLWLSQSNIWPIYFNDWKLKTQVSISNF